MSIPQRAGFAGVGGSSVSLVRSVEYLGKQGIIIESEGILRSDNTGLETCSAKFKIRKDRWTNLPVIGSAHPIFTYVSMEAREIEIDGPWAIASCDYAGANVSGSANAATLPVYELVVGLSEEPVETHPQFVSRIGGTAMAPRNGAIFEKVDADNSAGGIWYDGATGTAPTDNNGWVFKEFQTFLGGSLNPLAKVEAYLEVSNITWKKTWNSTNLPSSINNVGKISNPEGPAPSLGSGRNWLNMGISSQLRGSVYHNVQEWRASGRRGWNSNIYST